MISDRVKLFNVLLVDDDHDDQLLMQAAFHQDSSHYQIQLASDGAQALAMMGLAKRLPDLILLDLNMPIMNGLELLAHLKPAPTFC